MVLHRCEFPSVVAERQKQTKNNGSRQHRTSMCNILGIVQSNFIQKDIAPMDVALIFYGSCVYNMIFQQYTKSAIRYSGQVIVTAGDATPKRILCTKASSYTPSETYLSTWKIHGSKTMLWPGPFSEAFAVSFRECKGSYFRCFFFKIGEWSIDLSR